MTMEQTWRWYGPGDPVTLSDIRQTGATGIVTALHEIPAGEVWPQEAIEARQRLIERGDSVAPAAPTGLRWSVVESVPVHEEIYTNGKECPLHLRNYQQTLRNLAACGIDTVCYNFMPVVDWTRTHLRHRVEDGSEALRFDAVSLAAFDIFLLKRPGAETSWSPPRVARARTCFNRMSEAEKADLQQSILAGLPGSRGRYDLAGFQAALDTYAHVDEKTFRRNLARFLAAVVPTAEEVGVRLAIHPDDPPCPLFGLPRIVSTEADLHELTSVVDSPANGITLCVGSLGARANNDLPGLVERLGHRINFIHLRSVKREGEGSFHEANHLEGDVDMAAVVRALLLEQRRRKAAGRMDTRMPWRPDHGHRMLDDLQKESNPGYTAIGRLRGMAEMRGLEMGIERSLPGD